MIRARARSWIGGRWTIALGSLVLMLLTAFPALADDSWVGKLVIQKDRDFALKVGSKVVGRGDRMEVYRVEQLQGPWLWVKSDQSKLQGWVQADEVVPLDQAVVVLHWRDPRESRRPSPLRTASPGLGSEERTGHRSG